MKLYLPNKITNYKLYDDVILQLTNYYKTGEKQNPVISFVNTERINYESIPLVMGILDIIYNVNEEAVPLELICRPKLLYCLDHALFFHYADYELGYIEYNKEVIGGFSDYIDKDYRGAHVMHVYEPRLDFFDYSENEQEIIRFQTYEEMRYHFIGKDFGIVLADIKKLWTDEMENYKTLLAEIITNAILYSSSLCYALLYSDRHKTMLSICDVGRGFHYSLIKRRESSTYPIEKVEEFAHYKEIYREKYSIYKLEDFFDIMEVLFYSELQARINLFFLKNLVVNSGGVLRIHSRDVQVIFNTKNCKECNKSIIDCMGCLLSRMSSVLRYSPVKFFRSKLKGVQIEVEFSR